MPLKEGLIQGGTALVVFVGIGYVIYSKMRKQNPSAARKIKDLFPKKVYDKIVPEQVQDKVEQVWDEKRTMM